MLKSIDFESLAATILRTVPVTDPPTQKHVVYGPLVSHIADQLRQVWNARGAADLVFVECLDEGSRRESLMSALRTLDR